MTIIRPDIGLIDSLLTATWIDYTLDTANDAVAMTTVVSKSRESPTAAVTTALKPSQVLTGHKLNDSEQ